MSAALGWSSAVADVYKFVDGSGRVHYSDQPDGPGWRPVTTVRVPATTIADGHRRPASDSASPVIYRRAPDPSRSNARGAGIYLGRNLSASAARAMFRFNKRRFSPLIERLAANMRIESALVHAVVRAESAYDPSAVSRAGAVGLMQLMPGTANRYGVSDRYNPRQNLAGGLRYLRDLLDQFGDLTLALAAYNAGENAVIKYGLKVPPFPETQRYVRKVLTFYQRGRATS